MNMEMQRTKAYKIQRHFSKQVPASKNSMSNKQPNNASQEPRKARANQTQN
jgi:hypothetical protein